MDGSIWVLVKQERGKRKIEGEKGIKKSKNRYEERQKMDGEIRARGQLCVCFQP
jgi:hypothetical protein